jgi:hypothetical protein
MDYDIKNGRVFIDGTEHPELMLRATASKPGIFDGLRYVNWRTTVAGFATGLAAWVALDPQSFSQWPLLISFSHFAAPAGIIVSGFVQKDNNKGSNLPESELPPHLQAPNSAANTPTRLPAQPGVNPLTSDKP